MNNWKFNVAVCINSALEMVEREGRRWLRVRWLFIPLDRLHILEDIPFGECAWKSHCLSREKVLMIECKMEPNSKNADKNYTISARMRLSSSICG